jgi:hypothetical protein
MFVCNVVEERDRVAIGAGDRSAARRQAEAAGG